jgi:hypothetical protein
LPSIETISFAVPYFSPHNPSSPLSLALASAKKHITLTLVGQEKCERGMKESCKRSVSDLLDNPLRMRYEGDKGSGLFGRNEREIDRQEIIEGYGSACKKRLHFQWFLKAVLFPDSSVALK